MIPLPAVAFLGFVVAATLIIEVWCMWARVNRLTDELDRLRHDLGHPQPQPAPHWWQRLRAWLREVPGEPEPATTPMPTVTVDTQPSQAVVVGGARVTGQVAPKSHDWIEDALERYKQTGSWK